MKCNQLNSHPKPEYLDSCLWTGGRHHTSRPVANPQRHLDAERCRVLNFWTLAAAATILQLWPQKTRGNSDLSSSRLAAD